MMQSTISMLPACTDQWQMFPAWVTQYCGPHAHVLEVGAGRGEGGYPKLVRNHVGKLVAVDPDARIWENPYCHERFQTSLEEYARERSATFDCIYAFYVLEHVQNPLEFLRAVWKLLRAGGNFFATTPNLCHYFGSMAFITQRLGLQEWLLRHLRGRELSRSYHFCTEYGLNTKWRIERALEATGFTDAEFRYFDNPGLLECYFPGVMKLIPRLYSSFVYRVGTPQLMGTMMLRAGK